VLQIEDISSRNIVTHDSTHDGDVTSDQTQFHMLGFGSSSVRILIDVELNKMYAIIETKFKRFCGDIETVKLMKGTSSLQVQS